MTAADAGERTPEERYDAAMRAWATGGPNRSVMAELELIRALRDMIASRDAEIDRLTDALRALQGATS